ncbi:MAG: hypothetical protein AAFQ82_21260 [Myxococcota bacterium]
MTLTNPAPGIVRTDYQRHGTLGAAQFFFDYARRVYRLQGQPLWLFHDWRSGTGYDSEVRGAFMEFYSEMGEAVVRTELTFASRLIAMGVSAVSIVVRELHVHQSTEDFESQFRAAVESRKIG